MLLIITNDNYIYSLLSTNLVASLSLHWRHVKVSLQLGFHLATRYGRPPRRTVRMTLSPVLIQLRRKPVRRISSSLPLLSTARWGCGWGASWSSMVTDFPLKHRCYILLFIKEFYHLFVLCLHITDSDQTFMKQHWQAGSCNRNRAIQLDIVTATVLSGPHGDRTRSSLPVCNG